MVIKQLDAYMQINESREVGWEVEGRFKREGIYVYLWLIHTAVQQKPTQHCKAIILQFKNKFNKIVAMNINEVFHLYLKKKLKMDRRPKCKIQKYTIPTR